MKKISRRDFLKVAGISAAAAGLAACGGSSSSSSAPAGGNAGGGAASTGGGDAGGNAGGGNAAPAIEACDITFWYWADNDTLAATMEEMIADFNKTNEYGITVKGEQQNWDGGGYSNNLLTACLGGGGPDVATFKLTATPNFVENDLLYDLTPLVSAWDGSNDIDDNMWDIMKFAAQSDSIYVMPWNVQVLYVYYRPSYFSAAGVAGVPATYDEFKEAIHKQTMQVDGSQVYGFGMRGGSGGQEPWGSFVHSQGGSWYDLTTDGSVAGMQEFIDLFTGGYVPPNATECAFAEVKADFLGGKTAMTVHHCGSSVEMMTAFGDDVGAFIFPPSPKGQWTSLGDTETVMIASTKHPDAAFEWMKYLATGKGEATWCEASGNVPVSSTVQKMDFCQANRFIQASIDGIGVAGILPCNPGTSEMISEWPNITGEALQGKTTAAQACQKLNDLLWG